MKSPVLLELQWVVNRYVVAILMICIYRTSLNCVYFLYLTCSAFLKQWNATSYSTFWLQSCQCRIVLFKRWRWPNHKIEKKKASLSEQDFLMLWEIFGAIYTQRKQVTSDSLLESPFELSCVCLWNKGEFSWCWIIFL